MMVVDVTTADIFDASAPRELFDRAYSGTATTRSYDVSLDGRFVMLNEWTHPLQPVTQMHVILNWFEELKRLVPTGR